MTKLFNSDRLTAMQCFCTHCAKKSQFSAKIVNSVEFTRRIPLSFDCLLNNRVFVRTNKIFCLVAWNFRIGTCSLILLCTLLASNHTECLVQFRNNLQEIIWLKLHSPYKLMQFYLILFKNPLVQIISNSYARAQAKQKGCDALIRPVLRSAQL